MDFISWPELFLSIVAVGATFLGIIGLMIMIATELTEEGPWFLTGAVVPGVLLVLAILVPASLKIVPVVLGVAIALAVPWILAWRRRQECLRAIVTGQFLLLVGGGLVAGLIAVHYQHFAR